MAAVPQAVIFVASGSVALLAELIHNVGDALSAIPLGIAFVLPFAPRIVSMTGEPLWTWGRRHGHG